MKKLLAKMALFVAIILVLNLVTVIITPLNFFTFRSWEALIPFLLSFDGAFYPHQTIDMVEEGDLAKGTEFAIRKQVTFVTDRYGYRNLEQDIAHYAVVVVGDSMTVGSSLTQDDTLPAVLSRILGRPVYSYATASIKQYLADARFASSPPEIVILESAERSLPRNICPPNLDEIEPQSEIHTPNYPLLQAKILGDRFLRNPIYLENYLQSNSRTKQIIHNDSGMVFFEKSLGPHFPRLSDVEPLVSSLQRCVDALRARGTQFIFLVVPDKENIYFDQIPDEFRPNMTQAERRAFVTNLMEQVKRNNIAAVDLQSAFEQARAAGITPFQLDDTHWNEAGVEITATLLTDLISVELANTS